MSSYTTFKYNSYRARWYDPQVGRFVSEDPVGFNGGDVNLYSYVGADPVNSDDPSGLQGRPRRVSERITLPPNAKPLRGDDIVRFNQGFDIAMARLACSEECRKAVTGGMPGDPRAILNKIRSKGNFLDGGEDPSIDGETRARNYPTAGLGSSAVILLYKPFFNDSGIFGITQKAVGGLPGFDTPSARALIILHELRHAITGGRHPEDGTSDDWNKAIFNACFRG